jgi:hypothetical protein
MLLRSRGSGSPPRLRTRGPHARIAGDGLHARPSRGLAVRDQGAGGGGSSFGPTGTSFRSGVWGNLGDGRLTINYDPAEDACAG